MRSDTARGTDRSPIRAHRALSVLAVGFLVVVGLAVLVGSASAASEQRTDVGNATAPVVVFEGEQLDVTELRQTGGDAVGTGTVTFEGVDGTADGESFEASASEVDFTDVTAGGYDTDGDGQADVVVRVPVIRQVAVRTASGVNVTGGRIPADARVEVSARFNFADADRVDVRVVGPDGLEVTGDVLGSGSARRITSDGGAIRAEFGGQPEGTYRIEASASGLDAERSVTVVVRDRGPTATLEKTTVPRGETVVATVLGDPGETVHLRVSQDALDGVSLSDAGARRVFDGVGGVTDRFWSANRNVMVAVVELDERGEGRVRVQSRAFRSDRTATIGFAQGTDLGADPFAQRSLRVEGRPISITRFPATVPAGTTFELAGRTRDVNSVKAYARGDGRWVPLLTDAENERYAEIGTRDDGRFRLRVDSSRVITDRTIHRVAVTAPANQYADDEVISGAEFESLQSDVVTIRVAEGQLQASLSRSQLAADTGDEVSLSVDTQGRPELHLYLVTPRGTLDVAESVSTGDGILERDFEDLPGQGSYRFVVVTAGEDDTFESTTVSARAQLTGRETQSEALRKLRGAYSGSDDQIRELRLDVQKPTVSLTSLPQDGAVEPGRVRFAGTTNRQADSRVVVTVTRDGTSVASGETSVDADGSWNLQLDLSGAPEGSYSVDVDVAGTTYTRTFALAEATTSTPTPTATATPEPTASPTATATPGASTPAPTETAAPETPTATATPGESGPGFGPVVALVAVVATLALGGRRNR